MSKYIMAMDAGTTSNRCILFNKKGQVCSVAQREFTQYFPHPGWVEHDADEIWACQLGVAVEAMNKIGASAEDIAAIGITNQRETAIVWDRKTGEPVYNAIVWQCRRTSEYCDSLKEKGLTEKFRQKTGLVIDAYFSATKIKWILDNVPGARERAERQELLFGTVETWLIRKMTKGRAHTPMLPVRCCLTSTPFPGTTRSCPNLTFRKVCFLSQNRQAVSTERPIPHFSAERFLSRELPAISRPPFSVRLVFRPEKPKTLTERAAFY